jgi:DNA-binding NtrC family response regulator
MYTVLVIDDEDEVRQAVRHILEAAGHLVIEAADGNPGLKLYRERRPDLVITDIVMPDKEGIETIREILKFDPAARVIAMAETGPWRMDVLKIAESFGATQTLRKPIRADELLACVDHVLRDGRRRRAGGS